MQQTVTVTPAYGRDYTSKAGALADWHAGKDFRETASGQYCSARDFPAGQYRVLIRYARLAKITAA